MPFLATAVANELLDRARDSGTALTQINIQKLVYFCHGWHLAWSKNPLILDSIEAWQYGPVVRNLYNQFRRFGSSPITEKAVELRMDSFGKAVLSPPCFDLSAEAAYAKNVIGAVWQQYGKLSPFQLVELTHAPNSPWEKARKSNQAIISNDEIEAYFRSLLPAT
jgi:uncharacterized phage-associated protein